MAKDSLIQLRKDFEQLVDRHDELCEKCHDEYSIDVLFRLFLMVAFIMSFTALVAVGLTLGK